MGIIGRLHSSTLELGSEAAIQHDDPPVGQETRDTVIGQGKSST
jgi:hypothetical protein